MRMREPFDREPFDTAKAAPTLPDEELERFMSAYGDKLARPAARLANRIRR